MAPALPAGEAAWAAPAARLMGNGGMGGAGGVGGNGAGARRCCSAAAAWAGRQGWRGRWGYRSWRVVSSVWRRGANRWWRQRGQSIVIDFMRRPNAEVAPVLIDAGRTHRAGPSNRRRPSPTRFPGAYAEVLRLAVDPVQQDPPRWLGDGRYCRGSTRSHAGSFGAPISPPEACCT